MKKARKRNMLRMWWARLVLYRECVKDHREGKEKEYVKDRGEGKEEEYVKDG